MRTYDYIVKADEKVVVCIMSVWNDSEYDTRKFRFRGVAKCSAEDTFSEETGKKIAQRRALIKFKKACICANKRWLNRLYRDREEINASIAKTEKSVANMNDTVSRLKVEIAELS